MSADHRTVAPPMPERFHSLDALRGLAALAIVFWHWQCFFYNGTELGAFDPANQPFYFALKPFYMEGWRAVDLFFCLSGFIFFWLYARRIAEHSIGAAEFALLRISRLYPLHLVTLLIVAAAQWAALNWSGSFFIYPHNDIHHFVLHLFFVSNWGFERGLSFNAPVWSVSVEMALYALFFCVCMTGVRRWWQLLGLVIIGVVMANTHGRNLGRGISCFFTGGLVFLTYSWLLARAFRHSQWAVPVIAALAWVVVAIFRGVRSPSTGSPEMLSLSSLDGVLFGQFIFPITILALALAESHWQELGRRLGFLGDISYSSYLLHFPLILAFAGFAAISGSPPTIFYSPFVLLIFFSVLLLVSWCSHRWLERPAQAIIRARFSKVRRPVLS